MGRLRAYEYITGIEASAQPDAGTPTEPNDLVTLSFLDAFSERVEVVGSYGTPVLVDAADELDPGILASSDFYLMFVGGDGGAQEISANPQIAAPGRAGIQLTIVGTSDANSVTLNNGNGLAMNGPCELGDKDSITFVSIDADTWQEIGRA